MSARHAHGTDCCWPCFMGRASHPVDFGDGETDPACDENCPPPDERTPE